MVHRLLTVVVSFVMDYGVWSTGAATVVARRLSCPVACGIFPDQGSNLCLLHWQVASSPLDHHASPSLDKISENQSLTPHAKGTIHQEGTLG